MSFDAAARNRVHDWLFGQALPLWATAGIDDQDRFFEKLDFNGRPVTGVPRRTRVQARQIYVFCEATALGWAGGRGPAQAGRPRAVEEGSTTPSIAALRLLGHL